MQVFRLCRKKYLDPLSGVGAALHGARWNSKGHEVLYTAQNRALAMAEVLVHVTWEQLPSDFQMVTIETPKKAKIQEIKEPELPSNWQTFPPHIICQTFGDRFLLDNKYLGLKVPSAVVKGEFNLLLNPKHSHFSKLEIIDRVDFPFDERMFF